MSVVYRTGVKPEEKVVPRAEVMAFAVSMEKVLRKHDATKGEAGWCCCTYDFLEDKLEEEVEEVREIGSLLDNLVELKSELLGKIGGRTVLDKAREQSMELCMYANCVG